MKKKLCKRCNGTGAIYWRNGDPHDRNGSTDGYIQCECPEGPKWRVRVAEKELADARRALAPRGGSEKKRTMTFDDLREGVCPKREDRIHCHHWWDASGPCCGCGLDDRLNESLVAPDCAAWQFRTQDERRADRAARERGTRKRTK